MRQTALTLALVALLAGTAAAVPVEVRINGEVEYSGINSGPFGDAGPGDPANMVFTVDSQIFVDSDMYNVRAYAIDPLSFTMTFGTATAGLQSPYPGTPYFCIRESDPVADGFFVTSGDINWPGELILDEPGILGQFAPHFEVGYEGTTLSSLDIIDAAGSYGYDGLTSFWYAMFDDWAEAAGLLFTEVIITPMTTATAATSWSQVKSLY